VWPAKRPPIERLAVLGERVRTALAAGA